MLVRCMILAALAVILTATNPCRARGSTSAAAELFEAASAASARGNHVAAAKAFEQAYRNAPRGATAFNAAVSWEAADHPARAADAYARALGHTDLAPDARESAQEHLSELRAVLGHVVILAPADTTIDIEQVEGGSSPVALYVRPGVHVVVVRDARTVRLTRSIDVAAGEALDLDLRSTAAPPPPVPMRAPRSQAVEAHPVPLRTAGFVALGAAVALAGTATYLGISALDARDEFVESGERSQSAHDRAASLRTWTNVAWAGAGLMAAAAGVLILIVPTRADTHASQRRDRWHAGIGWSGRF
jgi:hypothetical protein